jgi:predicted acyltransferase
MRRVDAMSPEMTTTSDETGLVSTTSAQALPPGSGDQIATNAQPAATKRYVSVDALRGFDMIWIIGATALVRACQAMDKNPFIDFLARQLEHSPWEGFTFYDLIFPLFIFIMGVSSVFSLTKQVRQAGRGTALRRLFRRFMLLYAAGVFYYGGFSNSFHNMLLFGVLNRIAICYFFGGLIFLFLRPRSIAAIAAGLLLGYWALMAWVPIRDIKLEKGVLDQRARELGVRNDIEFAHEQFYATTNWTHDKYESGYNLANHVDFEYSPGQLHYTYWNPEGIVSTMPAIVTTLLGIFAGLLLRNPEWSDQRKLLYLFSFGIAGVLLGWLWHSQFPVIKKIWTSSFVLVAGGYSAILLGVFYGIVDVWKKQRWCQLFVWIGMNSITVYLAANILQDFQPLALRFVGGDIKHFLDVHIARGCGDLLVALVGLALAFGLARFLYCRKIFLRL